MPFDWRRVLTGYSLSSWAERDGVPLGPVWALAQDAHGYLWVGTNAGLLRFDGVRYVTADAAVLAGLPTSAVRALHVSGRDGALWVGFANHGVRVVRQGGVRTEPALETLRASVDDLAETPDGTMWAATRGGLWSYDGTAWHRAETPGDPAAPVLAVHVGRSGRLLMSRRDGVFERLQEGAFRRIDRPASAVGGISEDRRGHVWVTDPVSGFRRVDHDAGQQQIEGAGVDLFHDSNGHLWVTTRGQGLWRVAATAGGSSTIETRTVETGLSSNGVWSVLEDRDGNIWVGTHEGLNRLTPYTVTPLLDLGLVHSIETTADGRLWAGTARGLIGFDGDPRRATRQQLTTADTRTLYGDSDGALWVAAADGLHRRAGARSREIQTPSGQSLGHVHAIGGDASGSVWVADGALGLFRWNGASLHQVDLPAGRAVSRIRGTRDGGAWIAFEGGRVGRIGGDGRLEEFGAAHGFAEGAHTAIDTIFEDHSGVAWIGGDGGLTRYAHGRFATLASDRLQQRRVVEVIADDLGYLWLATVRTTGIMRLHPGEFDRALALPQYQMRYDEFGTSHGLAGMPLLGVRGGAARGRDGRLFFVTGRGITAIDPRAIDTGRKPVARTPRIEGAVADEEPLAPVDGASVPAGTSRLRIDYAVVQLTPSTPTRFRYRLEGFDAGWIDAGSRRQAFYTNLPPRAYRFVVQATRPDGGWNDAAAVWEFALKPMFHQTYTFYGACAAGLVLIGYGAWRVRLRQVRREIGLVFAERMRLSREIHDTVLQTMASVAVQCGAISNQLGSKDPAAHAQLVGLRRQVEEFIRDTRQAVWDLRSRLLETDDLAGAFRRMGRQATAGTPVRFQVVVAGAHRRYGTKLENEVLRIGQEAIQNAVQHARAERIRLEITFAADHLLLRVVDDGRGLNAGYEARARDGHVGLIGMQERAREIGGRLRIDGEGARGTEVELVVPAAAAHG